jgi:hypothetical protein
MTEQCEPWLEQHDRHGMDWVTYWTAKVKDQEAHPRRTHCRSDRVMAKRGIFSSTTPVDSSFFPALKGAERGILTALRSGPRRGVAHRRGQPPCTGRGAR